MGILVDVYGRNPTYEETLDAFRRYEQYLESIKMDLPPGARFFALVPWHYHMRDSRCPHDAWVEHLKIFEDATGDRSEVRMVGMHLRLLSANHDGYIEIRYQNVMDYRILGGSHIGEHGTDGHGDWYIDDICLSEQGKVVHEVLFERGYRWSIECDDLVYSWLPISIPVKRKVR